MIELDNRVSVLIIQHPDEEFHPFNTGRIVQHCLSRCETVVARQISEENLKKAVGDSAALLYPTMSWMNAAPAVGVSSEMNKECVSGLVLLDATWRKSKRLLHENPHLQLLPRLSLQDGLLSKYRIRKSSIENALSTVESTAAALELIEGDTKYRRLLEPFDKMVHMQLEYKPVR